MVKTNLINRKQSKLGKLLYGAVASALLMTAVVPVLASDTNYNFSFHFYNGNPCYTSTEWKDSNHATTMTCTYADYESSNSYTARVYSVNGNYTDSLTMYETGTIYFYDAYKLKNSGVYIRAVLNGYDTADFSGTWNPDNSNY